MYKTLTVAALAAAPALASNLNAYWGQTGDVRLKTYCDLDTFEYVSVGFVNNSPEHDTSGLNYPGTNFGNNCGAEVYENGQQKSKLLSNCNLIAADIPYCQAKGKKVLLSIGGHPGANNNYEVTSKANAEYFATFVWEAFGPLNPSSNTPRPFDRTGQPPVVVDGFDFDLEEYWDDDENFYPDMVAKLHELIDGGDFLVTAAPECPLATEFFKMKKLIDNSKFDALFIQFYNNQGCDGTSAGFNFAQWASYLQGKPSADALLFVGLPGSQDSANTGYLDFDEATALIESVKDHPKFGGVMLWDMHTATNNKKGCSDFQRTLHDVLIGEDTTPESCDPTDPGPTVCITEYTVVSGDTCNKIAFAHDLSLSELQALNPDEDCALDIGDKLCIERGPAPPASSSSVVASSSAPPSSSYAIPSSSAISSSSVISSSSAAITSAPSSYSSYSSVVSSSVESSESEYCEEESSTESVSSSAAPSSSSVPASVSASVSASASVSVSASVSASASVSVSASASVSSDYSSASSSDDYCYEESTESAIPSSSVASSSVASSSEPASVSATPSSSASVSVSASASVSVSAIPSSSAVSSNGPISSAPSASPSVVTSVEWTTSTVYDCVTETITSCAPGVTNCPVQVVTRTIAVSTTVCPVTTTTSTPLPTGWTTSTVYSTTTYTISKCAPTVANCPYGHVTTEIIPVSTTVCPITEGWPKPTGGIIVPTWQPDHTIKTSVTNTQFTTLTVPNPDKPATFPPKDVSETKPAGGPPAGVAKPSGTGWGGSKPVGGTPVTAGAGRNSAALGLSALAAVLFFAL
ncbi:glycoside hydrolase superfamily [Cercophora newfieldiana]|uniref:chitinase n=1 Tax=Cercophora newfieldiana TaxID=92897 RepID=A0AA40D0V9_9PEZI|nr:glycoside hydrolase superfamily [Cercophora newfieldiana]